jgi:hypothetical protein
MRDLQHAFARNVATSEDVFEEGQHLVRRFRAAEGDDEQRVVRLGWLRVAHRNLNLLISYA